MESSMPETVTVYREDWDHLRSQVSELFDCHNMIRMLADVVMSAEPASLEAVAEARVHLQHFFRLHG
jgi:hypothetical protein